MTYPPEPQNPAGNPPDGGQSQPPQTLPVAPQAQPQQGSWQAPPAAPEAGGYAAYGATTAGVSDTRPGQVTAGCVMTWVGGALGVILGVIFMIASSSAEALGDAGLPPDQVRMLTESGALLGGATFAISVAAIVFAILAFKRNKVGLWGLVAMAVVYLVLGIVGATQGQDSGVLGIIYVAVATGLILSKRKWFSSKPTTTSF